MNYGLVFALRATEVLAALPEIPHAMVTLACFDIWADPHGLCGLTTETSGPKTSRIWAVGSMVFIEYEVDEGQCGHDHQRYKRAGLERSSEGPVATRVLEFLSLKSPSRRHHR
jgi:hypothetical protein